MLQMPKSIPLATTKSQTGQRWKHFNKAHFIPKKWHKLNEKLPPTTIHTNAIFFKFGGSSGKKSIVIQCSLLSALLQAMNLFYNVAVTSVTSYSKFLPPLTLDNLSLGKHLSFSIHTTHITVITSTCGLKMTVELMLMLHRPPSNSLIPQLLNV